MWPFGENGHLKRIFSKTLSRVEIFENASFSFIYGRSKREVFEYDDVINHMLLALRMLCEGCCRISIVLASSYERAKAIRIRYTWTRSQKCSGTCGWVKLNNHVGKSLRRAITQRLSSLALLDF